MHRARLLPLLALVACGTSHDAGRAHEQAALGGENVARVGSEVVPGALVAKVASSQHVAPDEALRRLIDDAIAAESAKKHGLDRRAPAEWLLTAARARFLVERLLAWARSQGAPTDDEIRDLSALHWREVDRPPAIRVLNVVVIAKKDDPATKSKAAETARNVRDLLKDVATDDFLAKAKTLPAPPDVDIHVDEPLPAFIERGDYLEIPNGVDPAFAKGAFAIEHIGDTSPVVESKFGLHVIRLVERIPELRMPFEARRLAFTDETYAQRAGAERTKILDARRATTRIELSPAAESLMRSIGNP